MRFQRIIEAVYCQPWFITRAGYFSVRHIVESRIAKITSPLYSISEERGVERLPVNAGIDVSDMFNPRPGLTIDSSGIAHIFIVGVLAKNIAPIEKSCGNTDYADIIRETIEAKGRGAKGAHYYMNSPGGAVAGCAETMRTIADIGIPTVAEVDEQGTSATQFLACACDRIVAQSSATLGSIGCILPWVDESGAWEQEGLKFEPITNDEADLKGTGHGPSLSEPEKAALKEYVNDQWKVVREIMLSHRTIEKEMMRGQIIAAKRALDNNLIDAIGGEDEAYSDLLSRI